MAPTKICKACGVDKPLDEFPGSKVRMDGTKSYRHICKVCFWPPAPSQVCQTPGCGNKAARGHKAYCLTCWNLLRRTGSVVRPSADAPKTTVYGYVLALSKGHPLHVEGSGGYQPVHRMVFYDMHGAGPFKCHWCPVQVTWHDMHIDHVDDDKTNNDPSNLVPSCPTCNQWRNADKNADAAREANGKFLTLAGKTQCLGQWAREIGISHQTLLWRLKRWSLEKTLTTPPLLSGPPPTTSRALKRASR